MVRVLDMDALAGTPVGEGTVTVEVVDDELIGGVYRLESEGGTLTVAKGTEPAATVTAAGFSGLVYGVLDPVDVITRGFGTVSADAMEPLRSLFPRAMPYLFADF
jgi:hypothetical protein